jgi:hypothetical protein
MGLSVHAMLKVKRSMQRQVDRFRQHPACPNCKPAYVFNYWCVVPKPRSVASVANHQSCELQKDCQFNFACIVSVAVAAIAAVAT